MTYPHAIPLVGGAGPSDPELTRLTDLDGWAGSGGLFNNALIDDPEGGALGGLKQVQLQSLSRFLVAGVPETPRGYVSCRYQAATDSPDKTARILAVRDSTGALIAGVDYNPSTSNLNLVIGPTIIGETISRELNDESVHRIILGFDYDAAGNVEGKIWVDAGVGDSPDVEGTLPRGSGVGEVEVGEATQVRVATFNYNSYMRWKDIILWDDTQEDLALAGRRGGSVGASAATQVGSAWGATGGTLAGVLGDGDIAGSYCETSDDGAKITVTVPAPDPLPAAVDGYAVWLPILGGTNNTVTVQAYIDGGEAGPEVDYTIGASSKGITHPVPGVTPADLGDITVDITVSVV